MLPASYRWAVTIAVIVGFQIALSAAFDVQAALQIDSPSSGEATLAGTGWSPELQRAVFLAQRSGYQSAVTSMMPWRVVAEVLLALSAGAVFFLALRLRVVGEERARAAEAVGLAAMIAAVTRTIDAAQAVVIARTVAEHTAEVMQKSGLEDAVLAAGVLVNAWTIASIGWSFTVVALFMGLSTYFRSERVRTLLESTEEG